MKQPTFNRARLEILNYIVCFCTQTYYENHISSLGDAECSFIGGFHVASVGSLIKLSSAPFSEGYLSWVEDLRDGGMGKEYLLKSIETGKLCWWSNVGINALHQATVKKFPQWRWDDDKWAFSDKWSRVCKKRDAYIVLGRLPKFNGYEVTLNVRIRYGLNSFSYPKTFPDYRKLLQRDLLAYYDEASKAYDATKVA